MLCLSASVCLCKVTGGCPQALSSAHFTKSLLTVTMPRRSTRRAASNQVQSSQNESIETTSITDREENVATVDEVVDFVHPILKTTCDQLCRDEDIRSMHVEEFLLKLEREQVSHEIRLYSYSEVAAILIECADDRGNCTGLKPNNSLHNVNRMSNLKRQLWNKLSKRWWIQITMKADCNESDRYETMSTRTFQPLPLIQSPTVQAPSSKGNPVHRNVTFSLQPSEWVQQR